MELGRGVLKKIANAEEGKSMLRKIKENWKSLTLYTVLIVAAGIWIAVSNPENSSPEDKAYLESLIAEEYLEYESFGAVSISYSKLSESYDELGYTGTDEVIALLPENADSDGKLEKGIAGYEGEALVLGEHAKAAWEFEVKEAGLYSIAVDYAGVDGDGSKIQREMLIDGKLPCEEATNIYFYRQFIESGEVKINEIGDEVWPSQEEVVTWLTREVHDSKGFEPEPMYFYLEKGTHTLAFEYVDQPMAIREVRVKGKQDIPTYAEVKQTYDGNGYKVASAGMRAFMEGEESAWRSDSIIRRESSANPKMSPFNIYNRVLNNVGGSRWNRGEQSVSWNFEVAEDGLYEIGVKLRQNKTEGMPVYRQILVDGEVPFEEFLEYKFEYQDDWYGTTLADQNGEPYLVYLEKGTHELTFTAQIGPIHAIIQRATNDVSVLSDVTRDITKITGPEPDVNYEYNLYRLMPNLSGELAALADSIEVDAEILHQITNRTTSAENSIRSIVDTLREFSADVDLIPKALSELENAQTTLGGYITSLNTSPMSIDYIEVLSPEDKFVCEDATFFEKFYVSAVNFFLSFVKDYDAVGITQEDGENVVLEVWIGRGSEWGEILKEMIDEKFTPETGIHVNLNVMPSGQLTTGGVNVLMLSLNSGTAPDVALSVDYNLPSEFAFRDAAVDLTQFEDYEEVESWFYDASMIPYRFGEGVYALPETMDFTAMFYRKDIVNELGIELPQTWTQLYEDVLPVLYENSMSFNMSVDTSVSSSSPAALRGFTMMLLQNGGSYYSADGKSSALGSPAAYQAFKSWTNLYSQYEVDEESNLFTRMRTGETPIGIGGYSAYIQFLTSAPELYGRWGVALVPGIENEDGTISKQTGSISGTANVILSQSDKQDAAWEFMKWWMSAETQADYGRQLEAIIGESARWNTANVEAFYRLPWKSEDKQTIQTILAEADEQYIVPGGYFTCRHLINAWNSVVVDMENTRDALEKAVKDIDKELTAKIEEFGLQDANIIPQED